MNDSPPNHHPDLPIVIEGSADSPSKPTNSEAPSAEESIRMAFTDWHGKTAHPWQVDACKEIVKRHVEAPPNNQMLRPLLLVRSTGGGKSAVRDVSGFLVGGITLTIVPLLSLAADQTSKILRLSLDRQLFNRFHVFNLDVLRSKPLNEELRNHLEQLPNNPSCKTTVSLFSSPQKISTDPLWQKTIAECCRKGTLRLIGIDECHLYAAHGLEFRDEFGHLRKCFFNLAERNTTQPIPVLFMTATASSSMVSDLEHLTGMSFHPTDDMIWPNCHSGVHRRNIFLNLSFKDTPIRLIKAKLVKTCRAPGGRKLITYSNSRKAIIRLHQHSRLALNLLGIQKDLLLVHGNMYREQKFHHTDMFIGQPLLDECPTTGLSLRFDPVAFFATAAATSSGLDCPEVDKVIYHGFPPTIEDFLQCSGRCGRSSQAHPGNSSFTMVVSLNSLIALMTRIFLIPKFEQLKASDTDNASTNEQSQSTHSPSPSPTSLTLSPEALAWRQWDKVLQVLAIVSIDNGKCIHYQLESLMLNPYCPASCDLSASCEGARWRCCTPRISTPFDCRIDKERLKEYFVSIFITNKLASSKLCLHRDCFLNQLLNFETMGNKGKPIKNFHKAVFRVKTVQTARPRTKALLIKCFAAGI